MRAKEQDSIMACVADRDHRSSNPSIAYPSTCTAKQSKANDRCLCASAAEKCEKHLGSLISARYLAFLIPLCKTLTSRHAKHLYYLSDVIMPLVFVRPANWGE